MDLTREHADPAAGGLAPLVLDRQRVVHAAAFRRLQHKTQVFVAPESDHFRTRLTHTLEVAHLARVLAEHLGLSAELAEVAALAHDLGHPPFGHAGERALDACLAAEGGFEHNRQTLRVVELLEHPYPAFRGLNLTRAVRQCLAAHCTPYDRPAGESAAADVPVESAVVDLADRLAYALHDVQDGLYAGLLTLEALGEVELWRAAYEGPPGEGWRGHLRPAIDRMQRELVEAAAVVTWSGGLRSVRLSAVADRRLAALDAFLRAHLYQSRLLTAADERARRTLSTVFEACVAQPERMPERFRRRIAADGLRRVVADYVAGMTDRYCLAEFERLG